MQATLKRLSSDEVRAKYRVTRSDEAGSRGLFDLVKTSSSRAGGRPKSLQIAAGASGFGGSGPSLPFAGLKTPGSALGPNAKALLGMVSYQGGAAIWTAWLPRCSDTPHTLSAARAKVWHPLRKQLQGEQSYCSRLPASDHSLQVDWRLSMLGTTAPLYNNKDKEAPAFPHKNHACYSPIALDRIARIVV